MMRKFALISFIFIGGLLFSQNPLAFEKGKELYKTEDFRGAIDQWMSILDEGSHSAALYFNIGNAHYKLNNIGPSIYYYERALQLDPKNEEILNNLAFAQNATVDAIEPLPQTLFSKWYKSISGLFDYDGWAVVSVGFAILFVALFLFYYYSRSEGKKRIAFTSSFVSLGFMLLTLVMAFYTYNDSRNDRPAIIFAESSEIKSEPTLGSEPAFVLHEGTKVQIIATDGSWLRITIADGKEGWIPEGDLKPL